jgi:DNA-binding XRE family transcriptional regulator
MNDMPEFKNQAALFKKHRQECGYTQSGLAAALVDVHSQFISNWERGLCGVPIPLLKKLIKLLKISRKQLEDAMISDAKIEIKEKIALL